MNHTVDGKNPAPVDMANKNIPLFTRFYTSQVLQDVFHQQYEPTYRIHKKIRHKHIMQVTKSLIFTFWTTQCCEAASCLAAAISHYQDGEEWLLLWTASNLGPHWSSSSAPQVGTRCHGMLPENTLETLEDEVIPWCGGDVGRSSPLNFDALFISSCLSDSQCGFGS